MNKRSIELVKRAHKHLLSAIDDLRQAHMTTKGYTDDLKYFIAQISDIVSSDNGEAGLNAYINIITKKYGGKK